MTKHTNADVERISKEVASVRTPSKRQLEIADAKARLLNCGGLYAVKPDSLIIVVQKRSRTSLSFTQSFYMPVTIDGRVRLVALTNLVGKLFNHKVKDGWKHDAIRTQIEAKQLVCHLSIALFDDANKLYCEIL